MKLKNDNIRISNLGEERKFVSGTLYWLIEWATIKKTKFSVGDKVVFRDPDNNNEKYIGVIDWMIVTEHGNVEVSIYNAPIGRVNLESIEHYK